jgi:hypothetical protein
MPSVADPIALYTAPGKGVRHSGTTCTLANCGMQASEGVSIALRCMVRVTPPQL